ncbi:MAG TPA: hypothetical protein GXX15_02000 [Clostridia bacterium]|nr:hypothetical protein [Clostridia bacterium]
MILILSPDVKEFLKDSILTEQDLIDKMNELFVEYPKVYTFISTQIIKDDKIFYVDYATDINNKDIDCVYVREKTDDNSTIRELLQERNKKTVNIK